MKQLKTYELLQLLTKATQEQNQVLINQYAYELATRIFVPNQSVSIEEILADLGYKDIQKEDRQITIEEYMRTRKSQ